MYVGIQLLKIKYDDILQLLPTDYMKAIQAVQDHLTDKQICHILTNSSYISANKALLDCLIETFRSSSILYLCDQLEKILPLSVDPVAFFVIINEIRGKCLSFVHVYIFIRPILDDYLTAICT